MIHVGGRDIVHVTISREEFFQKSGHYDVGVSHDTHMLSDGTA
jgi:hypothetical protein